MAETQPESELCWRSARSLAASMATGELSAREMLAAAIAQIERVDPLVNAIPTRVFDLAAERAAVADERQASGAALGVLHGLPIAHKDLHQTAGIRTTMGSPAFANFVPEADELIIERIVGAGAITVGKTNTPEFGAGSQTFNPVFGPTANPYDTARTCGGSSGGAAVALACGMVPLADGSDMGGSLRNPANFCNVVGLRPTPGRVPTAPSRNPWGQMGVQGPMARTVDDLAFFLGALAGPDPRAPLSLEAPGSAFAEVGHVEPAGLRVAWSPTLGGLPVEPEVAAVLAAGVAELRSQGVIVEEVEPDLTGTDEVFETLRAFHFEISMGDTVDEFGDQLKETLRTNVEIGRALTGPEVGRAMQRRGQIQERLRAFQADHPVLLAPVSQVAPFSIDLEYPTSVDGQPMGSYLEWMRSCSRVTVLGCPALSVPCGFTDSGLPVGMQVIAPARAEADLLAVGAVLEAIWGAGSRRPDVAR